MIIKWYNGQKWESFFYGAIEKIKKTLRNIIKAINAEGRVTKECGHRHKNLSDLPSKASSRSNIKCVGDMSLLSDGKHVHDDFKKKLEDEEERAIKQLEADINYVKGLPQCTGSV